MVFHYPRAHASLAQHEPCWSVLNRNLRKLHGRNPHSSTQVCMSVYVHACVYVCVVARKISM